MQVSASAASPLAALAPGSLAGYWRFQRAVARAQLVAWLPAARRLLVDISGPDASAAAQAADRGHTVIRVLAPATAAAPAAEPHRARLLDDIEAGHRRAPTRRCEQRAQHADGGRLPRAVGPEEAVDLAGVDEQADPVDGSVPVELLDQPVDFD